MVPSGSKRGVKIYIAGHLRSISLEKHIASLNVCGTKSGPAIGACGTPNNI